MRKPTQKTDGETITLKEERKHNFIIVYDTIYKNTQLTTDEIALIIKLLSLAPTFKPTARKMADILKMDYHRFIKASKGLQEKGYLTINKNGKTSEWIIKQEPSKINLKEITKENLINDLINFKIDMEDLRQLHKLKYIDDKLFIETATEYAEQIKRIVKTKWLTED